MQDNNLGELSNSFRGTSRRDFLKGFGSAALAAFLIPFGSSVARAAQTKGEELFLKKENGKIIIGDNQGFSLDFIMNSGNWTNYAPDMYLEPDEDRVYLVGEGKGIYSPATIQEVQSMNMEQLWDTVEKYSGIEKITEEQIRATPALHNFIKKSSQYEGWPLADVAADFNPTTLSGVFGGLKRYVFFDENAEKTLLLWQLPQNSSILSKLGYWQTAGEDGRPKLSPELKDYMPNLKEHLKNEEKIILDPLDPLSGVFTGQRPVDFSLKDLNGREVSLHDYLGKEQAIILNFWATWCNPCVAELPDFQRLHNERNQKNISVLTINYGEPIDLIKKFMDDPDNKYTFPVLLDSDEKLSDNIYRVKVIPQTFIIGRDDTIKKRTIGSVDYKTLVEAIK